MNAHRPARHLRTLPVLCLMAACVPLPIPPMGDTADSRQNIGDSVPAFIAPGKTNRADVLLALGEPDERRNGDEIFVYVRKTDEGGIGFLVGGGMRGGLIGPPTTHRKLTIDFDRTGIVTSARTDTTKVWNVGGSRPP